MDRKLLEHIRDAIELVPQVEEYLSPEAMKAIRQRDKREPARREKEQTEEAIAELIGRRFARQQRKLMRLVNEYTGRKVTVPPLDTIFETDDDEEEFYAALVLLVSKALRTGIGITAADISIGMDWTLTNAEAAQFARTYAYELIRGIDNTTRPILQNAVSQFIETPGMTLKQLADLLPYDEQRAFTIAVTETTRAYAQGQKMAAEEVKRKFPGVTVMKIWHTNEDDRVCDLCGPLDNTEVELSQPFYPPDEYGDGDPARHPRCRCWESTYTKINERE